MKQVIKIFLEDKSPTLKSICCYRIPNYYITSSFFTLFQTHQLLKLWQYLLLLVSLHFINACESGNNSAYIFLLEAIFHTRISLKDFWHQQQHCYGHWDRHGKSSIFTLQILLWKKESIHVKMPHLLFLVLIYLA